MRLRLGSRVSGSRFSGMDSGLEWRTEIEMGIGVYLHRCRVEG